MNGIYMTISTDIKTHVATLELTRGKKLNTMNGEFFLEFKQCIDHFRMNDDAWVLLVTAQGKHFTAGLDLKDASAMFAEMANQTPAQRAQSFYPMLTAWQECFNVLRTCGKPTIASIQGKCIGGGIDLTSACDIRVCEANASFTIAEVNISVIADLGTLQRITRIVGAGRAREMALTGRFISAQEAYTYGYVTTVFDSVEELRKGALKIAEQIGAHSPRVTSGIKRVLNYSEEHTVKEGLEYIALYNSAYLSTEDVNEAVSSFFMKKKPTYVSRL